MHKEPVPAGGAYPLRLNGGHNRWSQHAIFRANPQLLRLQRGSPIAFVSEVDARARGIADTTGSGSSTTSASWRLPGPSSPRRCNPAR